MQVLIEDFGNFLEENPKIAKDLISKVFLQEQQERRQGKQERQQEKSVFETSQACCANFPTAQKRILKLCEIYLVEGDSANEVLQSKEGIEDFKVILPLRGKNIERRKAREDRAMSNEENTEGSDNSFWLWNYDECKHW